MWPFSRRRRPEGATKSDGAPDEVFRGRPPEWSSVAPMPVAARRMDVTIERAFRDGLTAFQDSRVTAEPLGHAVLPEAPAGRVEARALPPLVYVDPPPHPPAPPVETFRAQPAVHVLPTAPKTAAKVQR